MNRRCLLGLLILLIQMVAFVPVKAQDCIVSRLTAGGQGSVLPGDANNLRDQPSVDGSRIGQIPGGGTFAVLEGPTCDAQGRAWWRVEYEGTVGWTVEGQGSEYYVEPVEAVETAPTLLPVVPTGIDCADFSSHLTLGRQGRVLPGGPVVLRAHPNGTAVGGEIPAEGVFTVLAGPECVNAHRVWWQVSYGDIEGWLVEGIGDSYLVEPVINPDETLAVPARFSCPDTLPTRLFSESLGRVIPGGANRIRSTPSTDGEILGVIPSEGVFAVYEDVTCDGAGGLWHRIEYNGISGWTIEVLGDSYFVEPSSGGGVIATERQAVTPENLWQLTELARLLPEPSRSESGSRSYGIAVAWSPDSALIAVTDRDGVLLYNVSDLTSAPRRFASNMAVDVYPPLFNAAFSPDGRLLAAGSAEGQAYVWDIETGETAAILEHEQGHYVSTVAFSPDGRWLATGSVSPDRSRSDNNQVVLWDTQTFESLQTFPGFAYFFNHDRLTFSPDSERMLVVQTGAGARLLDIRTGEAHGSFNGSPAIFSADGSLVFSGEYLYQAETAAVIRQLPLSVITDADFHPAGTILMTASIEVGGPYVDDVGVRLWDAKLGVPLITLDERESSSAAFSPDGTLIAVLISGALHVYGIP